jgi:hypothetical protein
MGVRSISLFFFGAALPSCILLVDSSPTGDQFSTTCSLLASASPCATCVAQMCGTELDACCADPACRPMLGQVDSCAEAGLCSFDAGEDASSTLASCVTTKCATTCVSTTPPDGPSEAIDCSLDSIDEDCSCTLGTGNSQACNTGLFAPAVCCAASGWPSSGGCACGAVQCQASTDGTSCSCVFDTDVTSPVTCDELDYGTCCIGPAGCSCYSDVPCTGSETEVSSCNTATYTCASGDKSVSDCRQ